jgi:hypothetical protein
VAAGSVAAIKVKARQSMPIAKKQARQNDFKLKMNGL